MSDEYLGGRTRLCRGTVRTARPRRRAAPPSAECRRSRLHASHKHRINHPLPLTHSARSFFPGLRAAQQKVSAPRENRSKLQRIGARHGSQVWIVCGWCSRISQLADCQLADWTTRGCHRRRCVLSFRFLWPLIDVFLRVYLNIYNTSDSVSCIMST